MRKKKIIPLLTILVILFSGCMRKYEYKVVVYHSSEINDTITIKTTSYYPNFVLKKGTCNLKIIEPNPLLPWTRRTREIYVGYDQEGYTITSGLRR